jgi:L,D-transpeptidase catalytic domain
MLLALAALAALPAIPSAPPGAPVDVRGVAVVHGTVPLRERPNGRALAWASGRTEFGSPRVLSVTARRGPWLGVIATELPNGRLAWVHRDNGGLTFRRTGYSLHVDLSGRWLELRKGGRRQRRMTVGIGASGSETPTGRFAVTDKLNGGSYSTSYGCCILALSGHQRHLPAGWHGGDRLAIHGTPVAATIGDASSAGCLRAGDADLHVLMRRVPLGTPVFIRD